MIFSKTSLARLLIGVAVYIALACPLYALWLLSRDVRLSIIIKYYSGADLPPLSQLLLLFAPLDGWSYITPLAIAIATGCAVHRSIRLRTAVLILTGAIIQILIFAAAFIPYKKLTNIMGYLDPPPYELMPLLINILMVVSSLTLAALSVKRLITSAKN